jgi:uncharacterized protein (TIGR03435 family)
MHWAHLFAQTGADSPRFDVASVKANKRNDGVLMINNRGGQYTATGVSLRLLIRQAYQVQEDQIVGGPNWLDADHFDVVAKKAPQTPDQTVEPHEGATELQLMIRALLAERFKLSVHKETRDRPVYALVMARSDGRLGPNLRQAGVDCAAREAARGRDDARTSPSAAYLQKSGCGTTVAPGVILAGGQTMAQLATAFSTLSNTGSSLQRIVIDRTGLTGLFDVELHFTPEQIPNGGPSDPLAGLPPVDPNGPSIFTAVQEQLGLKLDSQRGPVDVLMIDRVERPTED